MWDGFEARKFPRIKARCQIFIRYRNQNEWLDSITENIGRGGFCAILEKSLDKLSQVRVRVMVDDGMGPIECESRVVWTVQRRNVDRAVEELHDTGFEFLNLERESENRIKRLLERVNKG